MKDEPESGNEGSSPFSLHPSAFILKHRACIGLGANLGAREASLFVGRMLELGPVAGLLISKCFAVILVSAALAFQRPRLVVFLNLMFTVVVTWNLALIVVSLAHLAT